MRTAFVLCWMLLAAGLSGALVEAREPVVTASAGAAGYTVDRAFVVGPVSEARFWETNAGFPVWAQVVLPEPRPLVGYLLSSGPDEQERMPLKWTVLASQGGSKWTRVDSRDVAAWNPNEERTFQIASPRAYTHYRLEFLRAGNPSLLRIYRVALQYAGETSPVKNFSVDAAGALLWPGDLRMFKSAASDVLADYPNGQHRARPGGTLTLQPLGDYMRSALDILPTTGKLPDTDARAELTVHRIAPSAGGVEMASYMALANPKMPFGINVESTGVGQPQPFIFFTEHENATFDVAEHFAEGMRMRPDGAIQFGYRSGSGPIQAVSSEDPAVVNQKPRDVAVIERQDPATDGAYDSDYLLLVAKRRAGGQVSRDAWRLNARAQADGTSGLTVRIGDRDVATIHGNGDVELATAGALLMHSPDGHAWRVTMTNQGNLTVAPK